MRAVLERDLVAEGSGRRAYFARTLVGLAAALVVIFAAIAAKGDTPPDEIGASAFRFLQGTVFWFLCAATPALLVASILVERRQHTLELLLASPVTVRGLLLGKVVARLGTVLAWSAAALPPLAVLLLFGGIPWSRLGNFSAAMLGAALEMSAWGMLVTCASRRMATGAVLGYLLPWLHWLGVDALLRASLHMDRPFGTDLLEATTPFAALRSPDAWPAAFGAEAPFGPGFAYLLFAACLAVAAFYPAAFLLAREEESAARLRPRIPRLPKEEEIRRRLTRGNPVAWKESLLLDTAWSRFLYYLLAGLMLAGEVAFLFLHGTGGWSREWNSWYLAGCFTSLAALAGVMGASSMSFEKTRGTLDVLRVTPLTPAEIVTGKMVGIVAGLAFLFLLPTAHLAISSAAGYLHPVAAVAFLLAALLYAGNFAVHGLAWGTVARSPFTAVLGGASLLGLSLPGCSSFCIAGPVLALLAMIRREDESVKKAAELLLVPAALGGSPFRVLSTLPPSIDSMLTGTEEGTNRIFLGIFAGQGLLFLLLTAVFLFTRHRLLSGMLQRELWEMTRGEARAGTVPWTGARWQDRRLRKGAP